MCIFNNSTRKKAIMNLARKKHMDIQSCIEIEDTSIEGRIFKSLRLITADNTSQSFDYIDHYEIDGKEFDYTEAAMGGATKHENRRLHEYILSRFDAKGKTILDVGCGNGWLAKHTASQATGVISMDLSADNVNLALTSTVESNHVGLISDGYDIPVKEDSLDIVVSCEVLEHTHKPVEFLKSLLSKVKQGGKLIITTPYNEVIEMNLCIHCNKKTPRHAHLHSIDEKKMKGWFELLEFERLELTTFSNSYLAKLRTHVMLKYLPFTLWKGIDKIINVIFPKQQRIMAVVTK